MLVYVASPYEALEVNELSRKSLAIEIAKSECLKLIKENENLIPLSPVLLFSQFLEEKTERTKALQMGFELLKQCDAIYLSTHKDAKHSKGMQKEALLAKELGIKELRLSLPL